MPDRSRDAERLLAFFRGTGRDDAGRSIETILSWDDTALEYHHDYIQWLFPMRVPSSVHPEAPILTEEVVQEFRRDPVLRRTLLRALDRMLRFYGLERITGDGGRCLIRKAANFAERVRNWLHPGNHNHLRLTRILTCLRTLGLPEEARALYACLREVAQEYPDRVMPITLRYWERAAVSS